MNWFERNTGLSILIGVVLMGGLFLAAAGSDAGKKDEACVTICETRGSEMRDRSPGFGCLCKNGDVIHEAHGESGSSVMVVPVVH